MRIRPNPVIAVRVSSRWPRMDGTRASYRIQCRTQDAAAYVDRRIAELMRELDGMSVVTIGPGTIKP